MLSRTKLVRAAAATAAIGATIILGLAGPSPAQADPKQFDAFVGVGSDTTQDVMNALSGFANGGNYTPVQTSAGTGQRQLISFDALGTDCVAPRGGVAFTRPNGSGNGRLALSRSMDGTGWGTAACGGPIDVSGLIDFARSSSGPSGTTTELTYIPFGRDGVSFAYYRHDGNSGAVTSLTRAQLTSLFSTGPQVIDPDGAGALPAVRVIPCGIQTGSGTFSFWNQAAGVSAAQELVGVDECFDNYGGRSQENSPADFAAKGVAADAAHNGSQVIIGFSAGAYIAKSSGAAAGDPIAANVGIGSITNDGSGNNIGSPVTGTAPSLAPNATFYNNATFGRRVYNILPSSVVDGFGNADIKNMFVGSGSALCQATQTIQTFGFLVAPDCGATTIRGAIG